ncbi:hypothetical protein X793_00560 [Dehalococcoides mccartyi CG4]|nr:hypothetical protein X793_00560 [Dehalococcoides mccartyi CG4]
MIIIYKILYLIERGGVFPPFYIIPGLLHAIL